MASIAAAAPQLLLDDLEHSIAFYDAALGFAREFTDADFYAEDPDGYVLCFSESP